MINPLRKKLIRQNVLEALKWADGFAVIADALRSHVDAMVRPPISEEEWTETIQWLVENGCIALVEASFDKELIQYAITERGRVLLATL